MIEQIEPLLKRSLDIANLHLAENLVSAEHVQKLQNNCELAREYIRQTGKIPPIPTIDFESLEKYPSLVVIEKPAETTVVEPTEPKK